MKRAKGTGRKWMLLRHGGGNKRPPRTGAEAAGVVGVAVEEGEGGDRNSNWSLMVDLPSLDSIVKETVSPATSNSSNKLKSFWNSGFIFFPDI